jgi:CheY-like chemotaxis protein
MIRPKLRGKKVDLFCQWAKNVPENFSGDPTRVRQILFNLLGNAAKFTKKGEIKVSIEMGQNLSKEGFYLIDFSVKDTGIGIPKESQKSVFESFNQGDLITAKKFGGTGLGLAITKYLVEMMGGKIKVVSEKGKGSNFIFNLRFAKAAPILKKDIAPVKDIEGTKVLIVDDNDNIRCILQTYCQDAGMEFLAGVSSAKQALEWLDKQSRLPDIVLSDIRMEKMNGYELAKKIRQKKKYKGIKLLAVTSEAIPGSARKSEEAGFDGYITKPVSREDLLKVVRTVIGDNRKNGQIVTKHMSEELSLKGIKVLIAEDNKEIQEIIAIFLRKLGCKSERVNNGEKAVEKLKSGAKFDIVLMDVIMPTMGGGEAAQVIRREVDSEIPIIALTAAAMKGDKERCIGVGMSDYLTKPIDLPRLKEKLLKWCKT